MTAKRLTFAAPALVILLAIVPSFTVTISSFMIPEILGVIFLTWITTSAIGFFLSTYVLNTRTAFLTVAFISIVLSVLPPVFYPLQIVPDQLKWIAELVPTTHSSVLIENAMGLPSTSSQVLISWLVLPVFTIIFLSLALFKAKWTEN